MYYRVKRYRKEYKSMFVLDRDLNLDSVKSRMVIEDCAKEGPKAFNNPKFIESQTIECISLEGKNINSDIIKE